LILQNKIYDVIIFKMAEWVTVKSKGKKYNCVDTKIVSAHPLNDTWVFWFHDLNSDSWAVTSYLKLFSFNTIEDFWILFNNITNVYNGMYYLMRQGYPPIWDDATNIKGGGWTFKVDKKYAHEFWEKLSCCCIGESLPHNVVGVSISPKIRFVTIRLWTNNTEHNPGTFDQLYKETENDAIKIDIRQARFTPNSEAHT